MHRRSGEMKCQRFRRLFNTSYMLYSNQSSTATFAVAMMISEIAKEKGLFVFFQLYFSSIMYYFSFVNFANFAYFVTSQKVSQQTVFKKNMSFSKPFMKNKRIRKVSSIFNRHFDTLTNLENICLLLVSFSSGGNF